MRDLPSSPLLNIPALSRLFNNTTNSYKYLFFLSLLDILQKREFDVSLAISLKEINAQMLYNAWYPYVYFKLSFGPQDQIPQKLEQIKSIYRGGNLPEISPPKADENLASFSDDQNTEKFANEYGGEEILVHESVPKFNVANKANLKTFLSSLPFDQSLQQYVPTRLLRVFFDDQLRSMLDSKVDKAIERLAKTEYHTIKPLYCLDTFRKSIIFHPDWATYMRDSYVIVRSWVSWEWLQYMERRNPNVPGVAKKLFPPLKRESLQSQTEYWEKVIQYAESDFYCIYSQKKLLPKKFCLDHYLPWSFVVHDQLWNLVPTCQQANSSKSDNIPSEIYWEDFIKVQHLGLTITKQKMPDKQWKKHVESYVSDLKLSGFEDLLIMEKIENAYNRIIPPLKSLAIVQGFSSNWKYQNGI